MPINKLMKTTSSSTLRTGMGALALLALASCSEWPELPDAPQTHASDTQPSLLSSAELNIDEALEKIELDDFKGLEKRGEKLQDKADSLLAL